MVSDASQFKVACKWLENSEQQVWSFTLSNIESDQSSGERELMALLKCLQHFLATNPGKLYGTNFIWATDSENLVAFINKGSPKWTIQQKVFEIYVICKSLSCTIESLHLLREDERIQQADHLSKVKDSDNWSIDAHSFNDLNAQFHFDIDVFADCNNARVPCFISKYYEQSAWAVDAFSVNWPGMAWLCPPTKMLKRVAKRIRSSKCKGILLVPMWP